MQETQVQFLGREDPLEKDLWDRRQSTPVFLPGKSHGQRSLMNYSSWGCKRIKYNLVIKTTTIFHCVCVPQILDPFICQWASRLLPCPSYCKQCCSEQWDTCVFFNFGSLRLYAEEWNSWVIWWFFSIPSSIMAVSVYIPTNSAKVFPFLHTLSSIYCL